ncbi:MFS general substrate transporter [Polyporus arcularius HHB13444]|uniref:MFS general substrate transporter n=1 Tax=Polyporus arcularius HHB13444 TaxID=1314778 RepID=A0A5C3PZ36_9APHY|nr:MFS general substrate transporter [Polyporus arcularius HHB13444]
MTDAEVTESPSAAVEEIARTPNQETPRSIQASDSVRGDDAEAGATPLPKLQLFVLLYLQLAEPIASTVIYPFVNQLVRQTGVTGGDERKTGYFAGLIESSFYAVEAVCVLQWGRASDRIGRKPVLLGGLLGLTLSMLGFGLARQYWALILARCAEGLLNGNIGVTKSMMAEVTDSTNRARGFAFLPMIWCLGATLGPIIGGIFAQPADRWPIFRSSSFWRTYPYFLPCVVAACYSISAFMLALIGLKEVITQEKPIPTNSAPCELETGIVDEAVSAVRSRSKDNIVVTTDRIVDPAFEKAVSLRSILIPRVLWPIVNYGFLALIDQCFVVLVPLVYSTSIPLGGLGMTSFTIGVIQGVAGFVAGLIQVFTFPWMHRKLGSKLLYTLSFAVYLATLALFPLISLVTKRAGRVGVETWVLIVLQFGAYSATAMTWGCIFIYISDGAPNQKALGMTNGLAQTTASIVRSVAPAASSSLFSVSLENSLAGGTMVYWILCALVVAGLLATRRLPNHLMTHIDCEWV